MATWQNTSSGAALAQDPSITLKNFIETGYTIGTPAKATVYFDTKFARLDKPNAIIVENMPITIRTQTLGSNREEIDNVKRVQVYCNSKSAKNHRWLIEQHILDIINTNKTGMSANGIKWAKIETFQEIVMQADGDTNTPQIASTEISRSFAMVRLRYENILVP